MLNDFRSHCLAAAFIGERPAFALADGTVRRTGVDSDCLRVHAASVVASMVPEEDVLLTTGEEGRVCRTDASGEPRELGSVARKWVTSVGMGGGRLAYAAGKTVWLHAGDEPRQLQHRRNVKGIAFTRDGARLAVAQQDSITVHDLGCGDGSVEPLELAWNDIHHACTFSPDGRFLLVASQNSFLHGWRLADRKHFRMLGYQGRVDDWAWTPDGAFIATSGAAAAIVWPCDGEDGPMGRNAIEVAPRAGAVSAVAWRPRDRMLAIGHADGAVQMASLQDPFTGRVLRAGGRAAITSVAWNRAGDTIAFGSAAGECGIFRVVQ